MPKLTARGLKWLKGFHLVAVSCWIGGGVALILLYFLKEGVSDGNVLYGINRSIHHVDSSFSNWGFFRHGWMIFKWIVTVAAILFGTFFLGPWETAMMEISGKLGISSLSNTDYLYNEKMNLIFGASQILVLVITVFISIFKPWKSTKARKGSF